MQQASIRRQYILCLHPLSITTSLTKMATSSIFEDAKRQMAPTPQAEKMTALKANTIYKIVSIRLVENKFGLAWILRVRESGLIGERDIYGNS
jgi:hypothetical protein